MEQDCAAVQHGDQTRCNRCYMVWDTNDPCPPTCPEAGDEEYPEWWAKVCRWAEKLWA